MEIQIVNNAEESRFETTVDGHLAKVDYRLIGGKKIALIHTEVPKELSSQGVGNQLAKFSLDYSRAQGWRVLPYCPFIAAYIKRHPEYNDIVDKIKS